MRGNRCPDFDTSRRTVVRLDSTVLRARAQALAMKRGAWSHFQEATYLSGDFNINLTSPTSSPLEKVRQLWIPRLMPVLLPSVKQYN